MAKFVASMALLKYFPAGVDARVALAEDVQDFVETDEQLEWLRKQVMSTESDWPSLFKLRAIFCKKFKPKDGISVSDALPARIEQQKQNILALPPGVVTTDPVMQKAVELAVKLRRPKDVNFSAPATPEEIAAAPQWLRRLEGYE
jgi:hypothetical protein